MSSSSTMSRLLASSSSGPGTSAPSLSTRRAKYVRVPFAGAGRVAGIDAGSREGAHRLQQPEPPAGGADDALEQRLVDELREPVRRLQRVAGGHRRRGRKVERTAERAEQQQQLALAVVEQPVRPVDRVVEREMVRRTWSSRATETDQPASSCSRICAAENARMRAAASSSASGMPSSRRQSATTLSMSSTDAPASSARSMNIRTASEARCSSTVAVADGRPSGATTSTCSPATPSACRLVARTRTSVVPRSSRADDLPRRVEEVLAVVDEEQDWPRLERLDETVAVRDAAPRRHAEGVEEGRGDGTGLGDPAEVHEPALQVGAAREFDRGCASCRLPPVRPASRDGSSPRRRRPGRGRRRAR